MADNKKIFTDLDLRDNKITKGNADNTIVKPFEVDSTDEGAIVSKPLLDEEVTYRTNVEDLGNPGNPRTTASVGFGGISAGDTVEGKTMRQLMDAALHPVQPPVYTLPTASLGITSSPSNEVGSIGSVELLMTTVLNDSNGNDGAQPYSYSGGSIVGSELSNSNIHVNSGYIVQEGANTWNAIWSYLGALIENDSHGNPDATGQFGDGTLDKDASMNGYWPWWVQNGNIQSAPTTENDVRGGVDYVKTISAAPTVINLVVTGDNSPKSVIVVVPDAGNTASLTAIKDGALPISGSFIRTRILDFEDASTSGNQRSYTVFTHNNGIGYAVDSDYAITISY